MRYFSSALTTGSGLVWILASLAGCSESAEPGQRGQLDDPLSATEAGTSGDGPASFGDGQPTDGAEQSQQDGGVDPSQLVFSAVDTEQLEADILLAAKARPSGSEHWQTVQDLCKDRLTALGYEVTLQAFDDGLGVSGVNVLGRLEGTTTPEQEVIVGAHYDSTPNCDGADDNASGVAGALEVARLLASESHDRTLTIACWDQAEAFLAGALAHAGQLREAGADVVLALSLEMIGYATDEPNSQATPTLSAVLESIAPEFSPTLAMAVGAEFAEQEFSLLFPAQVDWIDQRQRRGDFILWAGNAGTSQAVDLLDTASLGVELPSLTFVEPEAGTPLSPFIKAAVERLLGPIPCETKECLAFAAYFGRSDHAAFWFEGFPAIMATDTAEFRNPNYHCQGGEDRFDTLDLGFASQVVSAVASATASLLR